MTFNKLTKIRTVLYLFSFITLTALFTVGNLAEANLQAQEQQRRAVSQAPEGRVLQATTGNVENTISDALVLELDPQNPPLGSIAKLKVSVKKDKLIVGDQGLGFTIIGWTDCGFFSCTKAFEKDIKGTDTVVDLNISPEIYKSIGQKSLEVKATSVFTSFGSTRTTYTGKINFNVAEALVDSKGTISLLREVRDGPNVIKEFSVYDKSATSFSYDCGDGNSGKASAVNGTASFKCTYPINPPKTYTVTATPFKDGSVLTGVLSSTVVVTGQEGSTGDAAQQNRDSSDTSCVGVIDTPLCIINLVLGAVGKLIETMLRGAFLIFVGPTIEALLSIHTYEDRFANVIYEPWLVLRNLTNIAFILAIIAMGIATVFRISGYGVRDMMIKLIIGAFLVNFSLVIPQAILGIAETVQNQFLPANTGAIRAIANPLFTLNLFSGQPTNVYFGDFNNTVRIFLNVWMMLFAFIAFVGIAFLLLVRLVILWILLMTSPLIWAANIFPATKGYFKKWWDFFTKWAFITPVMAFMLNLTAVIATQQKDTI